MKLFETERCVVQEFKEAYLDSFVEYRNNLEWMKYQEFKGLDKEEYKQKLLVPFQIERGTQLAVTLKNDQLIGDLFVLKEFERIYVGYTIHPSYQRQGYMFEVLQGLLQYLTIKYPNCEIMAETHLENTSSYKLLEKLQFQLIMENKDGRVYKYIKSPSISFLINIPEYDLRDIYLRPIKHEDYKDMFDYGSDPEVTKFLSWKTYQTEEDALHTVENIFLPKPSKGIPLPHVIVDKQSNKMIGTCDFHSVDFISKKGEIGYCINRNYWGRGIMTRACKQIIVFGFEYLGLETIKIGHAIDNIGSKRVIEKCGFKFKEIKYSESTKREIMWYTLTKDEFYGN